MPNIHYLLAAVCLVGAASAVDAGDAKKIPLTQRKTLPTEHAYQKTLRQYLASLTAKDFEHGVTAKITAPKDAMDVEEQYRHWMLGRMIQPLMGTKRGMPAFNAPGKVFTLAAIETSEGVVQPPVWPETVAFLVNWNNPGNPYHNSRAAKLRAFVTMCIHLSMVDDELEHAPETIGSRSDRFAGTLIMLAYPYPVVKDAVPDSVRQAYEMGLRKMGRRVLDWGPKGEDPQMDLVAPVALWYTARALGDKEFGKDAEAYARRLYTDETYFNRAGYFVDRGGIDLGYAGQSNFLAVWTALATDWPFVKDAVDRTYRLRAHLCLPEPDGVFSGPSHFHTRYSADASRDQWAWSGYRDTAASWVTDEAAYLTKLPPTESLANAIAERANAFQGQINENPIKRGNGSAAAPYANFKNEELTGFPYKFRLWQSWNFPTTVSYAFDHYPAGAYAHRVKLEKENSPFLKSPFERGGNFIRAFEKSFTVTKQPGYAAILHTGPVGAPEMDSGFTELLGPYGFGGGQLSAFWTPATGSVLLGRRGGMTKKDNFDKLEDWQRWPLHAVSGKKLDGKVFTSARIRRPNVTNDLGPDLGVTRVSGVIPQAMLGQTRVLEGHLRYARTFTIERGSLKVETKLDSTGQDTIAELYETLPVFLRDTAQQAKATPTSIQFQAAGKWSPASVVWVEEVSAIRLSRFAGAVEITFDRPRRVKLADSDWIDPYLSKASCRNVLIDLMENRDQPRVLTSASVGYRIQAVKN